MRSLLTPQNVQVLFRLGLFLLAAAGCVELVRGWKDWPDVERVACVGAAAATGLATGAVLRRRDRSSTLGALLLRTGALGAAADWGCALGYKVVSLPWNAALLWGGAGLAFVWAAFALLCEDSFLAALVPVAIAGAYVSGFHIAGFPIGAALSVLPALGIVFLIAAGAFGRVLRAPIEVAGRSLTLLATTLPPLLVWVGLLQWPVDFPWMAGPAAMAWLALRFQPTLVRDRSARILACAIFVTLVPLTLWRTGLSGNTGAPGCGLAGLCLVVLQYVPPRERKAFPWEEAAGWAMAVGANLGLCVAGGLLGLPYALAAAMIGAGAATVFAVVMGLVLRRATDWAIFSIMLLIEAIAASIRWHIGPIPWASFALVGVAAATWMERAGWTHPGRTALAFSGCLTGLACAVGGVAYTAPLALAYALIAVAWLGRSIVSGGLFARVAGIVAAVIAAVLQTHVSGISLAWGGAAIAASGWLLSLLPARLRRGGAEGWESMIATGMGLALFSMAVGDSTPREASVALWIAFVSGATGWHRGGPGRIWSCCLCGVAAYAFDILCPWPGMPSLSAHLSVLAFAGAVASVLVERLAGKEVARPIDRVAGILAASALALMPIAFATSVGSVWRAAIPLGLASVCLTSLRRSSSALAGVAALAFAAGFCSAALLVGLNAARDWIAYRLAWSGMSCLLLGAAPGIRPRDSGRILRTIGRLLAVGCTGLLLFSGADPFGPGHLALIGLSVAFLATAALRGSAAEAILGAVASIAAYAIHVVYARPPAWECYTLPIAMALLASVSTPWIRLALAELRDRAQDETVLVPMPGCLAIIGLFLAFAPSLVLSALGRGAAHTAVALVVALVVIQIGVLARVREYEGAGVLAFVAAVVIQGVRMLILADLSAVSWGFVGGGALVALAKALEFAMSPRRRGARERWARWWRRETAKHIEGPNGHSEEKP